MNDLACKHGYTVCKTCELEKIDKIIEEFPTNYLFWVWEPVNYITIDFNITTNKDLE